MCVAVVIISACSESDLELVDPNQLSPETFFKTEAQIESAANSVYANLQTGSMWNRSYPYYYDLMGGDAAENPQLEANNRQFLNFSFDANSGEVNGHWESCYRGINKCNFVLDNAEKINASPLPEARKKKYLGEARFMRALYYFLNVIRFGDMPLITTTPTSTKGFEKSPKEDVYALIISDLQIAQNDLLSKDVEQKGRATSEAATALLGKVYLYLEEYDLALAEFVKLNGKFTLEQNFYDNFKEDTEFGPESIFEIAYDLSVNNNPWAGNSGAGLAEATVRGQDYGFRDWFNTYPAPDLLDAYEPGDIRYDESFYTEGDIIESTGQTVKVGVKPDPVPAGEFYIPLERPAGWRKYQNYYQRPAEQNASGINFKYMRYADVLLMMAECENQRPGGVQDVATGYINQVRARAELDPIGPGLSKEQVFEAIVQERRVELAGEQLRFSDLIRWGRAETELAGQGFTAKYKLWPIPQNEFNSNEALDPSTDQNPGY